MVFCVGASPIENPEIEEALPKNFTAQELEVVRWFYLPGGLNYEAMPAKSRVMMKMFVRMLKAKKDKTQDDLNQINMIQSSYDISDIKYIEPIIEYINK